MKPVLSVKDLKKEYAVSKGMFRKPEGFLALKGVSFDVEAGSTLAVVGESGCGKSTLARILTLIDPQTSGTLEIDGQAIDISKDAISADLRKKIQIVFQNPYGSLNPRQKVGDVLEEPLSLNTGLSAAKRRDRAMSTLSRVGLKPIHYNRFPHMFSGGQRQRIAIARAIILKPKILILDEAVSALDLSVQAQVINLLIDLQKDLNLTYVFISHDLSVVKYIAKNVLVMLNGEVVEYGSRDQVFGNPQHDYTKKLFSATPSTDLNYIKDRVVKRKALLR